MTVVAVSGAQELGLSGVALRHRGGDGEVLTVLDIPALSVPAGSLLGLRGPSGSGKTSFLHVVSALIRPDSGTVHWGETCVSALPVAGRDRWRRETVGLVFQDFHLIPELSVFANITLPATFIGWRLDAQLRERAQLLARRMRLSDLGRRAGVLSRGEQQRVAIARALIFRPALILADEPTASLDAVQAAEVGSLLIEVARESGATLICVSHDERLLGRMARQLAIGGAALTPVEAAA